MCNYFVLHCSCYQVPTGSSKTPSTITDSTPGNVVFHRFIFSVSDLKIRDAACKVILVPVRSTISRDRNPSSIKKGSERVPTENLAKVSFSCHLFYYTLLYWELVDMFDFFRRKSWKASCNKSRKNLRVKNGSLTMTARNLTTHLKR